VEASVRYVTVADPKREAADPDPATPGVPSARRNAAGRGEGAADRSRGGRVLLVDDDSLILLMLSRVLAHAGHTVETARDGVAALKLLEGRSYDVVVSDLNMPSLDGIALLRALRARGDQIPVFLMTGSPGLPSAMEAVEYGAKKYLVKPVQPQVLEECVTEAIATRRAHANPQNGAPNAPKAEPHKSYTQGRKDLDELYKRFTRALDNAWIAFQPIVRLSTREVFAYEALVRTREKGLSHPLQLLNAAERLDRVFELGRSLRGKVIDAAAAAPEGSLLLVNLHAFDLWDEELYDPRSPLASLSSRVVLEVTERHSLECVDDVRERAGRLRKLGFRIAIDDLGAGYAGLSSFTLLEPEVIKIDMALSRKVHAETRQQVLVRSLIRLGADLKSHVIAEGVETREERDTLVDLGCDLMQGFFFAKPGRGFPTPKW
jgi:EAL domain-containing protein (putative c-di-GMP-specific phosphodiesterase class I)/ActR/RegA family two-component response regulator